MQNIFLDGNSGKLFLKEVFSELQMFCFPVICNEKNSGAKLDTLLMMPLLAKRNKEENEIKF